MATKLVRVSRTVRQTYYIAVEGDVTNDRAVAIACDYVEDIGERGCCVSRTPWAGSARGQVDENDVVAVHATLKADPDPALTDECEHGYTHGCRACNPDA